MRRFENAQVGDKVICLLVGEGFIPDIVSRVTYPIAVEFENGDTDMYTLDGHMRMGHKNPSLFYLGPNGEMLTERPEPKPLTIHPDKVPVDTKVLVWICESSKSRRYFAGTNSAYSEGATSWSSYGVVSTWTSMELAEELTVDGIVYPVGTMIENNSSEAQNPGV